MLREATQMNLAAAAAAARKTEQAVKPKNAKQSRTLNPKLPKP